MKVDTKQKMLEVRKAVEGRLPDLQSALPSNISPEQFTRVTLTAIAQTPDLADCDRQSLITSMMLCAQDGLLPNKREAVILPFKSQGGKIAVYMPMFRGLLKLANNTGEVESVSVRVVHEKDQFEFVLGDNESIIHVPSFNEDRGKMIAAYAILKTKDGGIYREVMSAKEIETIKATSPSIKYDSSIWKGAFEAEMWRKTVFKRLIKWVPLSSEPLNSAIDKDDNEDNMAYASDIKVVQPERPKPPSAKKKEAPVIDNDDVVLSEEKPAPQKDDGRFASEQPAHDSGKNGNWRVQQYGQQEPDMVEALTDGQASMFDDEDEPVGVLVHHADGENNDVCETFDQAGDVLIGLFQTAKTIKECGSIFELNKKILDALSNTLPSKSRAVISAKIKREAFLSGPRNQRTQPEGTAI